MGRQVEDAIINVVINGEKAISSFKELNAERNKQLKLVQTLNKNAPEYAEQQRRLEDLNAAHKAWRAEIYKVTEAEQTLGDKLSKMFSADSLMVAGGQLIASGFQAALGAIKGLINGSEAAYVEAVKGQAQLDAALKSTKGVAGETKESLNDMAQVLMNQTGIDDDVISKGEEMLLTFTNIRGKIYEQALPAIVDMTAAMNQGNVTMEGIQASSIQVGKALNDPIKGMTALAKVGVTFNDQQKEQIKTLVESNHMMDAQAIILKELQKEFGGTAQAIANTDVGAMQSFNTAIGNLQENMGGLITSAKVMLASAVTPFVEWLGKSGTAGEQAAKQYKEAAAEVKHLDENIIPLLSRYDELQGKTHLTKGEHDELNTIIAKVTTAIPGLASQFDEYGKVIGISTDKAREFIAQQKAMLTYKNQDAIKKTKDDIADYTEKMNDFKKVVETGWTENKMMDFFFGGEHKGFKQSAKGIQFATEQVTKYGALLQGAQNTLKELNGEGIEIPDVKKPDAPQSGPTAEEQAAAKAKAEARKKRISELLSGQNELTKQLDSLNATQLMDTMDTYDKEVAAAQKKYDDLIQKEKEYQVKIKASKDLTPDQKTAAIKGSNSFINKAETEKSKAIADLRVKQEKDMADKIKAINEKLTVIKANEFDKQREEINAKYDQLVKDAGKNQDLVNQAEAGRIVALNDIDVEEKDKALQEKQKLEERYAVLNANQEDVEKATIEKKYEDELKALQNSFDDKFKATVAYQQLVDALNKDKSAELEKLEANKNKKYLDATKDVAQSAFNIEATLRHNASNARISEIEKQRDAELNNANLTQTQKKAINDRFDKIEKEEKLKAWRADQRASIIQAVINGALAMTKVAAQTGVLSFAFDPIIAAKTALEIGVIAAQKPPQFATGGILPNGPSHAAGGIKLVDPYGMVYGEIEGGEPVLSKSTYANNKTLVDALLNSNGKQLNLTRVNDATNSREIRISYGAGQLANSPSPNAIASPSVEADLNSKFEGMLSKMDAMADSFKNQRVVLSNRLFEKHTDKLVEIRNDANA